MPTYQYFQPTDEQKTRIQDFRVKFKVLAEDIKNNVEGSRGLVLCLASLEEAYFWLDKAITKNA